MFASLLVSCGWLSRGVVRQWRSNNKLSAEWHRFNAKREPFIVLVFPGGPDTGPVTFIFGILSADLINVLLLLDMFSSFRLGLDHPSRCLRSNRHIGGLAHR